MKKYFNKLWFFLSPHFSIRYYLSRDINYIVKHYKLHGDLLDIGCGEKPYKPIFSRTKYFGIDFSNFSHYAGKHTDDHPDAYFDTKYKRDGILPFKNNTYDIICAFQVLEHVEDPPKLLKEMFRLLKPDGYILLTLPFIWGLHEEPNDYYRFTEYAIENLVKKEKGEIIYFKKQGDILSVLETQILNYFTELNKKSVFFYLITVPLYPLILIISYISVILEKFTSSETVFLNYIFLIKN